jgi:hypothetical protein
LTGEPAGKKGRSNRQTERKGVRAAQGLFEDAGFLFQEVDLANDIGKDAYVDLAENDRFAGEMIAIQVKSGEKYRSGRDYKVPCGANDAAIWRGSVVPIIGIVYDLDAGTLHWADLTEWAKAQSAIPPASCPVPHENLLSKSALDSFVGKMRRRLREFAEPPVLDLAADDVTAQVRAVWDCWALGRRDARPLILLRASLRWLVEVETLWPAMHILSLATPHPDVFWNEDNRLPQTTIDRLYASFRWSLEEIELLLGAPAGDMWERGELGQSAYMLIVADPDHEAKIRMVIENTRDEEVAWAGTMILVSLADENGLAVLDEVASRSALLKDNQLVAELRQTLAEHGYVSLF